MYQATVYQYNQRSEVLIPQRRGTSYYGPDNHKPLVAYRGLNVEFDFFVKDETSIEISSKFYNAKKQSSPFKQLSDDDEIHGVWLNYTTGPISVGARGSSIDSGTAGSTTKDVEAYAIAFNVNDNMSISLATQDVEYDKTAGGTNVTETIDAINASYTMGAASVRATVSEASDDAGVAGADDEHMEISLVLSF